MDYTVSQIIQLTGKSQSTILRWVRKLKETNSKAVRIEKKGKTRHYLINADLVKETFLKGKETKKESLEQIPAGYVLIPENTLKSLEEQLKAKDEQIKKLQEVNYIQSGFIAQVKMLGAGQKKQIVGKQAKEKKASSLANKKQKKGFFRRIFGI